MRALVWDGERARLVAAAPEPECPPGTALVQVLYAGICSTDLQILKGYMGFRGIPGHEMVGRVVAGPTQLEGRRVVAEINFSCGRCAVCAAGRRRHCPTRTVMGILGADGAFADLVRVPVENLHLVPDELDDLAAVFVEPLAAAHRAEEQTRSHACGRTVVIGAGKLGLLVAQVLSRRGDDVSVVCRSESGERRVRLLGLKAVPRDCAQPGADLVVEASGSAAGLEAALELVRPRGAVVM
jgi:threonine dehydrogenase-like Zn-dependent dehydrogenase